MKYILAINPGSTSTKVAVYSHEDIELYKEIIEHDADQLKDLVHIYDQLEVRREAIVDWLKSKGITKNDFMAVVGRGGLLQPIKGGTYLVDEAMVRDLKEAKRGEHASNLGGIIAKEIADEVGVKAFIVDPVACDEMSDVARVSGVPDIERGSLAHYLNIKAVTRKVCREHGFDYDEDNFIVAHLGGGFSIGPLEKGRLKDVNNANDGGPFSPERSGTLPLSGIVRLAFSGKYKEKELLRFLTRQAGLVAHLGTNDARKVEEMIHDGDEHAKTIYEAMAYQVAKEIGASAAVLKGNVKAVILTGGLAYSSMMTTMVKDYVGFIAPVIVVPGEDEMRALYEGAKRVLDNVDKELVYEEEILI